MSVMVLVLMVRTAQMDGTLINSSPAVVVAWKLFAETYPLDLEDILACKSARELGSRSHPTISMLTFALTSTS